jgi:uncharacterized protein (TIRG00374 family)
MKYKTLAGILISLVLLYFAFREVEYAELGRALSDAQYIYLLPVAVLGVFSLVMRAFRWRILLEPIKKVGFRSLFSTTSIGLMANNLLPARLGEFVRAYLIGEREGISKSASLATIVIERILDGFAVLLFLALVIVVWPVDFPAWFTKISVITIAGYSAVIIILVLLRSSKEKAQRFTHFLTGPLPERVRVKISRALGSFIDGLEIVKNFKELVIAGILSLLVWFPNVVIIHLLLRAMGIELPFQASFVLLVILAIGIMIPSAPGFAGTIQYCSVIGLAIFSIPKSLALSFSIVYHAGVFIPVTGTGLVCLILSGKSLADLKKAADTEKKLPKSGTPGEF